MFLFLLLGTTASAETYTWKTTPTVLVCDNHVSREEVNNSIKYWQNNLDIPEITIEFNSSCAKKENTIRIYKSDIYIEDYGKTNINFFYYKSNPNERIITDVKIVLSDHMIRKDNITLRHELGHAFGLLHDDQGIMKPYW